MLTSKQIRDGFIEFFRDKEHVFIPSSPIVPIGDETLLFANAGMNQYKDIFLGLTAPEHKRAANTQKCLRVSGKHNDLEEVGRDGYHHTFFEMLGNWSFNDYFKAEAIEWAWELLTKVWGIDENKLWATVFAGSKTDGLPADDEAAELWLKVTSIPKERVLFCGRKDNFWEMGAVGPCGPCSEIHIDLGEGTCDKQDDPTHKCAVNAGCARYIELWNLVFVQYNRDESGKLNPLGKKYVDTGAGLERIAAVMQGKDSNYHTDVFMPIIEATSKLCGREYGFTFESKTDIAFRVIADHIRALTFAITDGAVPSNEGRGYIIRRILRRAARFGRELDMREPFIYKLADVVVKNMGYVFEELKDRADYVATVIKSEEESFGRTLDRGIEIFNSAADRAVAAGEKIISGDDAFGLYDTYGFPLDLTELMAEERKLGVDKARFDELMAAQRARARAAQKSNNLISVAGDTELPVTEDVHKYNSNKCEAKVLGFIDSEGFRSEGRIGEGDKTGVILEKTCFYAESGGQVGDCGTIKTDGGEFVVESTSRIANCVVHSGKVASGTISVGDIGLAAVSKDRDSIEKNHTATHLLQWALQSVMGDAIAQQGSLVSPEYLRFDFTCPTALTAEQTRAVEEMINAKIEEDEPVTYSVLDIEDAKKLGAMALFSEKYGKEVRVVGIGVGDDKNIGDAFSKEFCGGTHVSKLGDIGGFKIVKEESISAGVRRVTALTGAGLNELYRKNTEIVEGLCSVLKVPADDLPTRIEKLMAENKDLVKQLKNASKIKGSDIGGQAAELLEKCEKIGDASIVVGRLDVASVEQGRGAIDMIKKKAGSAAVVLGIVDADKVMILAGVTDDLIEKGVKAGDIVKQAAPIVGGGGGGRANMAQAGGKDPAKVEQALQKALEIIKEKLSS